MRLIQFTPVFFLLMGFFSCHKPCISEEEVFNKAVPIYIQGDDKKKLPYSSYSKLTYLLNDTSIIVFSAKKKDITFALANCGDQEEICLNCSSKLEQNYYEFESNSKYLKSISLNLKADNHINYQTTFDIQLRRSVDFYHRISPFDLSKFPKIDSIKTFSDSIYYNLYRIELRWASSDYYDTIYYSPTKGIIKILTSDGDKFELLKNE